MILADLDQNQYTTTKTIVIDHSTLRKTIHKIALTDHLKSDKYERVPDIGVVDEVDRL